MTVYDENAFAERVNFAANYISQGRPTTRHFDTCFEMWDGDAVAVAIFRRALRNPVLHKNLWQYLGRSSVLPVAWKNRRRPRSTFAAWAAELRREAKIKSDEELVAWRRKQTAT